MIQQILEWIERILARLDALEQQESGTGTGGGGGGGFTNPMSAQDDLIVGGASGAATRLAKGSDSQVLTVDPTTHHVTWSTPAAPGMTNPMTTAGDIIRATTGGTPERLAIGSEGQVLTVIDGVPVWNTPAAPLLDDNGDVLLDDTNEWIYP